MNKNTPHSNEDSFWSKQSKRIILRYFSKMEKGRMEIELPCGEKIICGDDENCNPAKMRIRSSNFFKKCVLYGDIGLGEAYVEGDWDTDDISSVISWFILNVKKSPSKSVETARSFFDQQPRCNKPNKTQIPS